MIELMLYLYGILTGLVTVAALIAVRNMIIKRLEHGWAGSAPDTYTAIKESLNKSNKPY